MQFLTECSASRLRDEVRQISQHSTDVREGPKHFTN